MPELDASDEANPVLEASDSPREILRKLWGHSGVCSWCFRKRRLYYREYDEALASHLHGRNRSAFESLGHSVEFFTGDLLVNTATSTPNPSTFKEVVPPTTLEWETDDGEIEERHISPRSKTICECGLVDYSPTHDRTIGQLCVAVEQIDERLSEFGLEFDLDAALDEVVRLARIPQNGGRDRYVLTEAIDAGRTPPSNTYE